MESIATTPAGCGTGREAGGLYRAMDSARLSFMRVCGLPSAGRVSMGEAFE